VVRALLLDLDKTLVNVEDHVDYCAALATAREAASVSEVEVRVPPTTWGRCAHQAMELLVALSGDERRWLDASDAIERWELEGAPRSVAMPGLRPFLEATAGLPIAIVTLLGPRATRAVVDHHGIAARALVPREPHLRPKPAADQVREALRRLGMDATDALMIGDSSWDEAAARAAGVRFLGLRNGRAGPGFSGSPVVEGLDEASRTIRPRPG